jgi:anti-anti-sigma factor
MRYSQYGQVVRIGPTEDDVAVSRPVGCRIWSRGGLPVVSLPAEVDILNAHLLRSALLEACIGAPVVVADMSETTVLTAAGINAFVAIGNLLRRVDGELRLVVGSAHVQYVLEAIGIDQLFHIFTNLAEALASDRPDPLPYATAA